MSEHLDFFGLSRSPFADESHGSVVVGTRALRKVVSRIQAALRDASSRIGVLGVEGVGKTRLAHALPKLFAGNARVATVFEPALDWRTLRGGLARDWQLAGERLSRTSLLEAARGHRLVLVIDGAEQAPETLFEHLEVLHDIEDEDGAPVLTVILFVRSSGEESGGANAAQAWLERNAAARVRFEPLSPDSVADYLERQLARVGCSAPIFTPRAALAIHAETDGVPGAISQLAERLLIDAAVRRMRTIDEPFVRERQAVPRERTASGAAPAEDAWDDADHHPRESSDAAELRVDPTLAGSAPDARRASDAAHAIAGSDDAHLPAAVEGPEDPAHGFVDAASAIDATDPALEAYLSAPPTAAELRAIRGGYLRRNARLLFGISAGIALGGVLVALLLHSPGTDGSSPLAPAPAASNDSADASDPSPSAGPRAATSAQGPILVRLRGPVPPDTTRPATAAPVASPRDPRANATPSSTTRAVHDAPSPLQRAGDFEDDDELASPPAHVLRDDDSGSDLPDLRPTGSAPPADLSNLEP